MTEIELPCCETITRVDTLTDGRIQEARRAEVNPAPQELCELVLDIDETEARRVLTLELDQDVDIARS